MKPLTILSIVASILLVSSVVLSIMVIERNNQYRTGYYQGWEDGSQQITERAIAQSYREGYHDGYNKAIIAIHYSGQSSSAIDNEELEYAIARIVHQILGR